MKTTSEHHKNPVSKRDIRQFIGISSLIFSTIVFSARSQAADSSKTEADGVCVDCVINSLMPSFNDSQFKGFKAINTAIFSADPNGQTFIDPRKEIDRSNPDNKQLNAIGLVTVTGVLESPPDNDESKNLKWKPGSKVTAYGTGFLINDCLVITNQHVTSLESKSPAKDLKITFAAGAPTDNNNSKFLIEAQGHVVAEDGPYSREKSINKDWAIIKLDKAIGKTTGYIQPILGSEDDVVKIPVSSASFYSDKSDGSSLWGQKSCSIFKDSLNPGLMTTNCPAIPGVSGAPIFAQNPQTKQIFALGLIEGGKTAEKLSTSVNAHNANKMVLFSKAFSKERLQEIIEKNRCDNISI
jgi:V8-like Glu-specific endopeptidase